MWSSLVSLVLELIAIKLCIIIIIQTNVLLIQVYLVLPLRFIFSDRIPRTELNNNIMYYIFLRVESDVRKRDHQDHVERKLSFESSGGFKYCRALVVIRVTYQLPLSTHLSLVTN